MNFLVIGEPCVDIIRKKDGSEIKSYGGILYSLISMSILAGKDDVIYPVMNLGEDEYENILELLKRYPNIKTSGIHKCSNSTRKVFLDYSSYSADKEARFESCTQPAMPISFQQIEAVMKYADAALINMISGVDVQLDTIQKIRSTFKGYIHMDVHNIVMKTDDKGVREQVSVDNWIEWCTNADSIQMNEFEARVISKDKKREYEIAEEILITSKSKVKIVIITKGRAGLSAYCRKIKKYKEEEFMDLDKVDIAAIENVKFSDPTGCGDVFASAFLLDYCSSKNLDKALNFANRMASYKASLDGISQLDKLK